MREEWEFEHVSLPESQHVPLAELAAFMDWGPFFQTWDLAGKFPAILQDEIVGAEATKVYEDGQKMLRHIIEGRWLTAHAVVGFWPANRVHDDDIALYADENRDRVLLTWHGLRQQTERPKDAKTGLHRPSRCLADFIAPRHWPEGSHDGPVLKDYIGAFAVTAGIGVEEKAAQFLARHDDYNAILFKSLADRLAEAGAEWLHRRVRTDWWGYAADEALDNAELIAEKYQGIRPAPGYPACPDHTVKQPLFELLGAGEIGMCVTDQMAMMPASSVSGFYFSHPESTYFSVGKINEEQAGDMARRRGIEPEQMRRILAPNLNL